MKKLTISLIQMDVRTAKVEENLDTAARLIERASRHKPDFIVLPEMWSTGFAYKDLSGIAKEYFERTMDFIKTSARNSGAIIIGGTIPEPDRGKVYNTCFAVSPSKKVLGSFRKVHIFSPAGESEHFEGGTKAEAIDTEFGKIGIVVCYDIRFPELIRKLWSHKINILFVPAQFPSVRVDHWLTLLKARAIENQIFVAGCNRTGKDRKYEYPGESVAYDPYGRIVEKGTDREEVVTASIDMDKIKTANEAIPVSKDRKPEIYK